MSNNTIEENPLGMNSEENNSNNKIKKQRNDSFYTFFQENKKPIKKSITINDVPQKTEGIKTLAVKKKQIKKKKTGNWKELLKLCEKLHNKNIIDTLDITVKQLFIKKKKSMNK
jgi:hypothetical protein